MISYEKWLFIFLLFLLFRVLEGNVYCQDPDYKAIFGDDWKKAEEFEAANRSWMKPMIERNRISYPIAIAVIFPELVRYSSVRDKIELTLLKALYINAGDEYADFSVGVFQVKPSFAELVAKESYVYNAKRHSPRLALPREYDDIREYRKDLVTNLENPETELEYIIAFMKICEKKYKVHGSDDAEKVRFLATAYNCGIDKSAEQISLMMNRKYFNTGLVKSTKYSYSDISLFWFNKTPEHSYRLHGLIKDRETKTF